VMICISLRHGLPSKVAISDQTDDTLSTPFAMRAANIAATVVSLST